MKDILIKDHSARMLSVLAASGLLIATGALSFGDSNKNEAEAKSEHAHQNMTHGAEHGEQVEEGKHPLKQLWAEINAARSHLHTLVETGELEKVHEAQEELSGLINQLSVKSQDFEESKQKRIKGTLKSMDKLLEDLHEVADAGRAEESKKKMEYLDSIFSVLKAQYPAHITSGEKAMEEKESHHEERSESHEHHGDSHH